MDQSENTLMGLAQQAAAMAFSHREARNGARAKMADFFVQIRQRWTALEDTIASLGARNGQLEIALQDEKNVNIEQARKYAEDVEVIRRDMSQQVMVIAADARSQIDGFRQDVIDVQAVAKAEIEAMRVKMQASIDELINENAGLRGELRGMSQRRDQMAQAVQTLLLVTQQINDTVGDEVDAMSQLLGEMPPLTSATVLHSHADTFNPVSDHFMEEMDAALASADIVDFPDMVATARAA